MGKDLNGKELGTGISQRPDGPGSMLWEADLYLWSKLSKIKKGTGREKETCQGE